MKTLSPLDAVTQFDNAMNKGDLETALGLYEPGASLVAQPAQHNVPLAQTYQLTCSP